MPRIAANLAYLFTERPLIERFAAAAQAGFKAVELRFPYDDHPPPPVKAELDRHGLTMLGLNTAPGGQFGTAAVPGKEQEFEAAFRQALDYAVAIGARAVPCLSGAVPPAQRAAAEATFVANMSRAADLALAHNIRLLVEPINQRERPDYFVSYVEHAADLIARIGRPNVKVQYDFYHVQIMQGDLIRRFERHLPVIGHVQIAAVPSRHEPDEGEVSYPAIFEAIDQMGYEGHVACEYFPRGRTEDGLAWARPYGVVPRG